jgi:excisionase family DNA binding protein
MPRDKLDSALLRNLEKRTDIAEHARMPKQKNEKTPDKPRFLRLTEIAREARVSLSTVRHWVRIGTLRSTKLGRHRMVSRAAFEAMISAGES